MASNWIEHYDESHQASYYYNSVTNETSWEKPAEVTVQSCYSLDESGENNPLKAHYENGKVKPKTESRRNLKKIVPSDIEQAERITSQASAEERTQQDYIGLSKLYVIQRPYSDHTSDVKCVLCRVNMNPRQVFYPCQHRCVCDDCITSQQVCAMADMAQFPSGFCNCPLCGQIIKRILPAEEGGKDEDRYWEWVLEVKPPLPDGFMKGFRHSAAIIQKVHIEENVKIARRKARKEKYRCYPLCAIS